MNRDDIIRMAGHREVPPWVLKLVMDCVEVEREECAKVWRTTMNRDDIIRMATESNLSEEHMNECGYYCVICNRLLPADDCGVIVHDPIPHPPDMDFAEEEKPQ